MKLRTAATPISMALKKRGNGTDKVSFVADKKSGTNTTFTFDNIVGESPELNKSVELAKRFAYCPENILLIGESGTGKELFAQSIHNLYQPAGPFIAVNCAAIPKNLIESELFGYESGSFTGAERNGGLGKIELADEGTLFLDEIGDMPLELQAVLLRVLEDKQVMRIGGKRYKKIDFRLIAATNKDLRELMQKKLFREDLYFRLSVLSLTIPPLRQREGDVELLSRYFLVNYGQKLGWRVPHLSQTALDTIRDYDWPGNVRQLKNAMIYAMNTSDSDAIQVDNLPAYILDVDSSETPYSPFKKEETVQPLKVVEKIAIKIALNNTGNNIPKSAELLGISKTTLYRKIKQYAINY